MIIITNKCNKPITYSGPLYKYIDVKGNQVFLSFDHAQNGLRAKQNRLEHFVISAKDKKFIEEVSVR